MYQTGRDRGNQKTSNKMIVSYPAESNGTLAAWTGTYAEYTHRTPPRVRHGSPSACHAPLGRFRPIRSRLGGRYDRLQSTRQIPQNDHLSARVGILYLPRSSAGPCRISVIQFEVVQIVIAANGCGTGLADRPARRQSRFSRYFLTPRFLFLRRRYLFLHLRHRVAAMEFLAPQ